MAGVVLFSVLSPQVIMSNRPEQTGIGAWKVCENGQLKLFGSRDSPDEFQAQRNLKPGLALV